MDLDLTGRTAFVAASSQGLGYACARSLAREGAAVVLNGRDDARLAAAVETLHAELGRADVGYVVADLTTAAGLETIRAEVPEVDALGANMIPAVQLIRTFLPGMQRRGFGRIVNVTSAMVKTPRYEMGLSTSARAALTAISKAISTDVAADNVTINNLLPERIDTPRQDFMTDRVMRTDGVDRAEARRRIAATIAARRFGRPEEFGDACAFLCSAQAGYISGQNLQLDGGSYGGLV